MTETKILSVGGSIIAPNSVDTNFLKTFTEMAFAWINQKEGRRLIFVAGGGAPARVYQNAYKEIVGNGFDSNEADWIGIMATRLNAQLLKAACKDFCKNEVVYNPTENISFDGKILVAAGWKPGFSTDNDAVLLAEKFNADTVVNLSNIEKVYTADPKKDANAKPLDYISWKDFRTMVGDDWAPGANTPFDPVASKKAEALNLKVICASGKNIENILKILNEENFIGTTIGRK